MYQVYAQPYQAARTGRVGRDHTPKPLRVRDAYAAFAYGTCCDRCRCGGYAWRSQRPAQAIVRGELRAAETFASRAGDSRNVTLSGDGGAGSAVGMYGEGMCAHYLGLSDEEVDRLVEQLSGERLERPESSPAEAAAPQYEQRELDYPQSERRSSVSLREERERRWVDVYPKTVSPVIVPTFDTAAGVGELTPGALERAELSWGYRMQWNPQPIFNTRIESADKPIWRASMEHDRCVIACRRFYEFSGTETRVSGRTGRVVKQQYAFTVPGMPIMFIGGIRRGDEYSMITTHANAAMAPVHPRMPLILHPTELTTWLGPQYMRLADRSAVPLAAHEVG